MIKQNFYLMAFVAILVSTQFMSTSCVVNSHVGNGNVVKEEREISGFNSISASAGLNVYLTQSDEEQVVIEADENLMEYIITDVRGNELKCAVEGNIRRSTKLNIYVSYHLLNTILVSSGADIELKGQCDHFSANSSSGADIKAGDLSCKSAEAVASSAGDIRISVSERINANASSGGDVVFHGSPKTINIDESSGGDVKQY